MSERTPLLNRIFGALLSRHEQERETRAPRAWLQIPSLEEISEGNDRTSDLFAEALNYPHDYWRNLYLQDAPREYLRVRGYGHVNDAVRYAFASSRLNQADIYSKLYVGRGTKFKLKTPKYPWHKDPNTFWYAWELAHHELEPVTDKESYARHREVWKDGVDAESTIRALNLMEDLLGSEPVRELIKTGEFTLVRGSESVMIDEYGRCLSSCVHVARKHTGEDFHPIDKAIAIALHFKEFGTDWDARKYDATPDELIEEVKEALASAVKESITRGDLQASVRVGPLRIFTKSVNAWANIHDTLNRTRAMFVVAHEGGVDYSFDVTAPSLELLPVAIRNEGVVDRVVDRVLRGAGYASNHRRMPRFEQEIYGPFARRIEQQHRRIFEHW